MLQSESLAGGTDYTGENWYESSASSEFNYDTWLSGVDGSLSLTQDEDGWWSITLTDEQWEDIVSVEVSVLERLENGYLYLGTDNLALYEGNTAYIDYDGQWLTIGDNIVSFIASTPFEISSGTVFCGYVPAVLNGTKSVLLYVEWPAVSDASTSDSESNAGYVVGYIDTESSNGTYSRGIKELVEGDTLDFYFEYYPDEGGVELLQVGDTYTVTDPSNLTCSYADFAHNEVTFWGSFIDVYGNSVDTDALTIE